MPLNKNDILIFYVPHEYAQKTGLIGSGCHIPMNTEDEIEMIVGEFLEYDDWGGMWIRATYGAENNEIMIPRDVILFILVNPNVNTQKSIGFKLPEKYKNLLDK